MIIIISFKNGIQNCVQFVKCCIFWNKKFCRHIVVYQVNMKLKNVEIFFIKIIFFFNQFIIWTIIVFIFYYK